MEDPPGYPISQLIEFQNIKPVLQEEFVCYEVACFASSTRSSSREGKPINTTGSFVASDASGSNKIGVEVNTEDSRRSAEDVASNREAKSSRFTRGVSAKCSRFAATSEWRAMMSGSQHQ